MKNKNVVVICLSIMLLLASIVVITPALAKPTTFTSTYNQAQFQWRCTSGPLGDWTYVYQNSPETSDYKLTGNVLHTAWSYSPLVTDLTGQSTIYTYDAKNDVWKEKEGQVHYKYVPGYGDYKIANFFQGYVKFDGTPSETSFEHGVAYQWVYLYAPYSETPPLTNAVWHQKRGGWLVGFSIYLWDSGTQNYDVTIPYDDPSFPDPFIEPVPANDYNTLGL